MASGKMLSLQLYGVGEAISCTNAVIAIRSVGEAISCTNAVIAIPRSGRSNPPPQRMYQPSLVAGDRVAVWHDSQRRNHSERQVKCCHCDSQCRRGNFLHKCCHCDPAKREKQSPSSAHVPALADRKRSCRRVARFPTAELLTMTAFRKLLSRPISFQNGHLSDHRSLVARSQFI